MAQKQSAGILLFRKKNVLEIFLVHPGGPFWKNKDAGAWSIPKGEFSDDEEPLAAAKREFFEETGASISGNFIALNPIKQKAGKIVYAWAVEGDIDAEKIVCNTFKLQWPPKSGKWQDFPEVDKAGWLDIEQAKEKINEAQFPFIEELVAILKK